MPRDTNEPEERAQYSGVNSTQAELFKAPKLPLFRGLEVPDDLWDSLKCWFPWCRAADEPGAKFSPSIRILIKEEHAQLRVSTGVSSYCVAVLHHEYLNIQSDSVLTMREAISLPNQLEQTHQRRDAPLPPN